MNMKNGGLRSTFVPLFLTLSIIFLFTCGGIDRYTMPSYFVSYSSGWGVRRFIGTIIDVLFQGHVNKIELQLFVTFFVFVLIAFFALFLSKTIASTRNSEFVKGKLFIMLTIITSPFSISYLFPGANFGRMELYLLILVFSYLSFENNIKNLLVKRVFMYSLLIIGCLIHQIFVFLCLPYFAMTALCDWYSIRNTRLIVSDLVFISLLACFVLHLQFGEQRFDMSLLPQMSERTNVYLHRPAFELEYNSNFSDHLALCLLPNLKRMVIGFVLTMIMMIPFIYILFMFWRESLNACESKLDKIYLYVLISLNVPILCCFLFAMDYGRWFAQLFLYNFVLILFLSSKEQCCHLLQGGWRIINSVIDKRPILIVLFIGYCSSLQVFQASLFFPFIEKIISALGIVEVIQ